MDNFTNSYRIWNLGDIKTKRWNRAKLTNAQRKDRVKQKKESFLKKKQEAADN